MTFTHTMIETPHVFMNMHKKKIIQIIGHGEFSSIWMWPWQISTWVYWHRKLKAGQEWNLLSTITQTPKDGHNNSLKVTHARTHARARAHTPYATYSVSFSKLSNIGLEYYFPNVRLGLTPDASGSIYLNTW